MKFVKNDELESRAQPIGEVEEIERTRKKRRRYHYEISGSYTATAAVSCLPTTLPPSARPTADSQHANLSEISEQLSEAKLPPIKTTRSRD